MHSNEMSTPVAEQGRRTSAFVIGMVCGAAVGAAIGLAFAPKEGAQLRRDVADSTNRLKQKAAATYSQAADTVGDVVERGRRAVDRGREAYQAAMAGGDLPPSARGNGPLAAS